MRSEGFYVNEKSTDTSWDRSSSSSSNSNSNGNKGSKILLVVAVVVLILTAVVIPVAVAVAVTANMSRIHNVPVLLFIVLLMDMPCACPGLESSACCTGQTDRQQYSCVSSPAGDRKGLMV